MCFILYEIEEMHPVAPKAESELIDNFYFEGWWFNVSEQAWSSWLWRRFNTAEASSSILDACIYSFLALPLATWCATCMLVSIFINTYPHGIHNQESAKECPSWWFPLHFIWVPPMYPVPMVQTPPQRSISSGTPKAVFFLACPVAPCLLGKQARFVTPCATWKPCCATLSQKGPFQNMMLHGGGDKSVTGKGHTQCGDCTHDHMNFSSFLHQ